MDQPGLPLHHRQIHRRPDAGRPEGRRAPGCRLAVDQHLGPGKPGYLTASKAKARIKSTGAKVTAFLFDNGGKAGRLYGARTTPGAYVIGKDGQLLYQGAVDDDDRALGEVHHNYVTEALADIAAHRPVAVPETRQYGCPVEY